VFAVIEEGVAVAFAMLVFEIMAPFERTIGPLLNRIDPALITKLFKFRGTWPNVTDPDPAAITKLCAIAVDWTAPKASYLHYFQPNAKKSAYLGGGVAWGGVFSREREFDSEGNFGTKVVDFTGIIPSVMAGYEFSRKSVLGFTELTISQPALSVYRKGSFPGPCVEFSTGIGF